MGREALGAQLVSPISILTTGTSMGRPVVTITMTSGGMIFQGPIAMVLAAAIIFATVSGYLSA